MILDTNIVIDKIRKRKVINELITVATLIAIYTGSRWFQQ
jgi:hypothetical protein